MGAYVKNKKDMKFQSVDALKTVVSVLNEVDEAKNDLSRNIKTSAIPEALAGALGVGMGAAGGFAALYLGGSVVGLSAAGITSGLAAAGGIIGGGMVAGIAVLAAPAVILGSVGVGVTAHVKNQRLRDAKNQCYTLAISKQSALIEMMKNEQDATAERLEYLTSLNVLLKSAIKDLALDLGYENS